MALEITGPSPAGRIERRLNGRPPLQESISGKIAEAGLMEPAPTISIVSLFLNADVVVKGVLILLFAASVWSWAVIIDKLWRLAAISRAGRVHEAPAPRARSR